MSMNFFELETIVLLLTLMMAYRMNALGMRHTHLQVAVHLHSKSQSKTVEHELVGNGCEGGWL